MVLQQILFYFRKNSSLDDEQILLFHYSEYLFYNRVVVSRITLFVMSSGYDIQGLFYDLAIIFCN